MAFPDEPLPSECATSITLYREALRLWGQAEQAARDGRDAGALYVAAARRMEDALHHIPVERRRTRALLAASALQLYRLGGDDDAARRLEKRLPVDPEVATEDQASVGDRVARDGLVERLTNSLVRRRLSTDI